jgi:hypothetical protein
MEESQTYMEKKLVLANGRRHGTTLRRPKEVFEQEEAQALKALPALAYEIEQFHEGVVRQDGHVRFANKYYSVDEKYKGQAVVVLGSSQQVSIYHKGQLLEVHPRITDPNQSKSTKPGHLKPWERSLQDDSLYRRRAQALGPHVDEMILKLLARGQGFIDTRKVWGILSLDKEYTAGQIDAACQHALELGELGYRVVKDFLEWEQVAALAQGAGVGKAATRVSRPAPHKHVRPLSVYRECLDAARPGEPVEPQLNLTLDDGLAHPSMEPDVEGAPSEGHA